MILFLFILIPIAGGLLAWITAAWNKELPRWVALLVMLFELVLAAGLWWQLDDAARWSSDQWIDTFQRPWMPRFGISFSLAMDGLSLLMLVLTFFLGTLSVLVS